MEIIMAEWVIPLPIPSVQNAVLQVAIPVIKNSEEGDIMIHFFQSFSIIISCIATVMIVVLLIRESKITRKFETFQEKDSHTIDHLTKEKESLKSEILDKLSALTTEEKEQQTVLNTILNNILQKLDKDEKIGDDFINLLEFKIKKIENQIEDKISERISKFQQDISSIKDRLRNIEEKLAKEVTPRAGE